MQSFLEEDLMDSNFQLNPGVNCFFIDNEAYRFLVAKKQDYPFKITQEMTYRDSWDSSVYQVELMFDVIFCLPPHNLEKTVSLNNARKMIIELAQPMIQLQNNIGKNIENIRLQKLKLQSSNESKEELARSLHFDVCDLEMKELKYPSTVCTASKCVEVVKTADGEEKINYKTRCDENCSCLCVTPNRVRINEVCELEF